VTTHYGEQESDCNGGTDGAEEVRAAVARATRLHDELSRAARGPGKPVAPGPAAPGIVADRLAASVVRPLAEALARVSGSSSLQVASGSAHDSPALRSDEPVWEAFLWQLTTEVTGLAVRPGMPDLFCEAAAALQDLVWRVSPAEGPGGWPERLAALKELQTRAGPMIQASLNGPYLVTGVARLTNWLGENVPARPQMALCRCGASAIKPLCDGSHARVGFTSAKDPGRVADRRDSFAGQQVTILDNRGICQHSGYCTDRLATVFHQGQEPFVTPSCGRMDEIIRAVRDCPSGALSYAIDGREAREQVDYGSTREPGIEVSKDGPYRVTGGIALIDTEGNDESRNDGASLEHYALCRCGHSQNKPFCSGMHWHVEFHDPLPSPEPTIFEWCGGLPALTRMTRLFYEKYVPQDPLLAPLFAGMSPDHPQRVAKWLAEVFCGPRAYSQEYGGYSRMISQHIGKGLTEQKRARWVALLLQCAQEAGLPNDAEWCSAFGAYIEWGSRLAVENSQPGARPPGHMPMPHWDWHTAAGPPGSRVSALADQGAGQDAPVVPPAAGEPVRFEEHIKTLFRQRDRQSMSFAFDLWAYPDVKANAAAILRKLQNGSMPCDGAWPAAWVDVFARWLDAGTPR
jgi:CDGSH-type Zn-finger protein/truncated hemoglobin YjbI